jgi:predicted ATPase
MHTLLNRFFALALDLVHHYEGTINQFLGDGFMALFGAPIAHEDHARRAVLAALALQRTFHDHQAELGGPYGVQCAFRMGLHSGLVVVGSLGDKLRADYSAIGETTNLAARLQQIAAPDTILVSERTAHFVRNAVYVEGLPSVEVKGIPTRITPYKVVGTRPHHSRLASDGERRRSRLVGRTRELALLDELLAQVEAGHGHVVGLVAEAGGGKSRLLDEFQERVATKQITYVEGRCLSYGRTMPYHLLIDLLRQQCGLTEMDSPPAIRAKVQHSLRDVDLDPEEHAPYVLWLLGIEDGTASLAGVTPEALQQCTFTTLRLMSLHGSHHQPLLLALEDLHWIDRTSEVYFASFVESIVGAPILLLTTYRPGYRPPWMDKSYVTQLALRNLAPSEALTLVRSISPHRELPDPMAQVIVEKGGGNPFFLEELTQAILDHAEFQIAGTVPETIQGVLMARIDRLPEAPKRLLQTAAVLGREFSPLLLAALWEEPEPLDPLLQELTHLELLDKRTGGEGEVYVFKHVLTQEVAYDSLLTTRRRALHAVAGHVLEAQYAARLEEVYDRLAYHYARSEEIAKAVAFLHRVAERAARGYAHTEAVAALQEALELATQLPEGERDRGFLTLALLQCESLHFLGRRRDIIELLLSQQERLDRLHDPVLAGQYHTRLAFTYSFLGERQQAIQSARRALTEAQHGADQRIMGIAYGQLGTEDYFAGRLPQAVEHFQRAMELLASTAEHAWRERAVHMLGLSYYATGDFGRALEIAAQMEAHGAATGDQRTQTRAASLKGWSLATRGDWEAGIAACQHALTCAPDAFETAVARGLLGYAYLEQGDLMKAIPVLEQAVEEATQYRSRQVQSWFRTFLGEAYGLDRQLDKARDLASRSFALARDIKSWGAVGLAKRALGRLAQAYGAPTEAARHLHEALQIFIATSARFEQARTHLDLAALTLAQGEQAEAARHLAEASALCTALDVPSYVERARQLASAYGVLLSPGKP